MKNNSLQIRRNYIGTVIIGLVLTGLSNAARAWPDHLQVERYGAPVVTVGERVFVLGGVSNTGRTDQVEAFGFGDTLTTLLQPDIAKRYFHTASTYNGKIYIVGGTRNRLGFEGTLFEEYDPVADTVRTLPPMPLEATCPGSAVVGDKLYVVGGDLTSRRRGRLVQVYDFKTEVWSAGTDMFVEREGVVMTDGKKIYAPGGFTGSRAICAFQVYNPQTDTWERLTDMPVQMSAHSGVVLGDYLYTFGDYDFMGRVAVYSFKDEEWRLLDVPYKPSRHHGATVLGDTVVVAGGNTDGSAPYWNYIQTYTRAELESAPRKPWVKGEEVRAKTPQDVWNDRYVLDRTPLVGKRAPNFIMTTLDGESFTLSSQVGKVVVLTFEQMHGGFEYLAGFSQMAREYTEAGAPVVFVNVVLLPTVLVFKNGKPDDDLPATLVIPVLEEDPAKYLFIGMRKQDEMPDYSLTQTPTVVVIGTDGMVRGMLPGYSTNGVVAVQQAVDALLAGEALALSTEKNGAPARRGKRISDRSGSSIPRVVFKEPYPLFFHEKWRVSIHEYTHPRTSTYLAGRPDFQFPAQLIVQNETTYTVLNPENGKMLARFPRKTIERRAGTRAMRMNLTYFHNAGRDYLLGSQTTFTGEGTDYWAQWMCWDTNGDVIWKKEFVPDTYRPTTFYALKIDEGYTLLGTDIGGKLVLYDPADGEVLFRQTIPDDSRLFFLRPSVDGTGTELLVQTESDLVCYDLRMPSAKELSRAPKGWSGSQKRMFLGVVLFGAGAFIVFFIFRRRITE